MLRLTLRSRQDGRLQARIVDRDGVLFVLDYGEPAMLADASRRVLHGGFTVSWQGAEETVSPGSATMFRQLALYYAAQGFLVCVDEPDWPRPALADPTDAPPRSLASLPTLIGIEPPLRVRGPTARTAKISDPGVRAPPPKASSTPTRILSLQEVRRLLERSEGGPRPREPASEPREPEPAARGPRVPPTLVTMDLDFEEDDSTEETHRKPKPRG